MLTGALIARVVLLLNHVLRSEGIGAERLRPHAGRGVRVELRDWPRLLPAVPPLAVRVTPAGLLEWAGQDDAFVADLVLEVDASNPALMLARGLGGQRPRVDVQGDAAMAADVSWLVDNLRWDIADDLSRAVGPAAAQGLARFGATLATGLREALRIAATFVPGPSGPRR